MKIGVISDTHGSLAAWEKAFERHFRDADLIVHCGDLFYHGPRNPLPPGFDPLALAEALNACPVPLVIAGGNCDAAVDASVLDWPLADPFAHLQFGDKKLLAWHEGEVAPGAAEVVRRYRTDVWLTGHTHRARLVRDGSLLCLNPGSPSLSKLPGGRPTIGVLDDQGARVIYLDTGEIMADAAWTW
ncbi:MAG: phosphodiesterase [Chitinophagales bacterium]